MQCSTARYPYNIETFKDLCGLCVGCQMQQSRRDRRALEACLCEAIEVVLGGFAQRFEEAVVVVHLDGGPVVALRGFRVQLEQVKNRRKVRALEAWLGPQLRELQCPVTGRHVRVLRAGGAASRRAGRSTGPRGSEERQREGRRNSAGAGVSVGGASWHASDASDASVRRAAEHWVPVWNSKSSLSTRKLL